MEYFKNFGWITKGCFNPLGLEGSSTIRAGDITGEGGGGGFKLHNGGWGKGGGGGGAFNCIMEVWGRVGCMGNLSSGMIMGVDKNAFHVS